MLSSELLLVFLQSTSVLAIIILVIILTRKIERIKQLYSAIEQLKISLEEMDEQAKLIVRTDMELNKTQEELDKKLSGLYTLQKLSRTISTTLEEDKIFKKIKEAPLGELGFERVCGMLWNDKENKFMLHLAANYTNNETEEIKKSINLDKDSYLSLIKKEKTFSSASLAQDNALKTKLNQTFKVNSFIVSPILPKEKNQGFLFAGTNNTDISITEGDEELFAILSSQIGQALENARLFENTWKAQQDLERKVEERTHALSLALEEVKKISRRKTDFVSSVSHELRTPLTSVKGYAAILLTEKLGVLPPQIKERVEKINRHSDELTHMVNDLLDISRIESGKAIMQRISYGLKPIAEKIADLLSVQTKEKQIELALDIPQNIPNVFIDPVQIERVFINIIGNAVKFTPVHGRINVSAQKLEKTIQINITDTGCGIPEETQEMIFEEFYRVDNSINQQVKGTGLGLTLVKHIIEAHNGTIRVKSRPGHGSTFSFTLPAAE